MSRLKTTRRSLRQAAPCLCLAALLLVLAGGCGQPPSAAVTSGGDAATDQAPAADTNKPSTSAVPAEAATAHGPAGAQPVVAGVKLSGRVVLDGSPPERRVINTSKDPACGKLHGDQPVLDEELIVGNDGGLKNAFVYLRQGAPKKVYPTPEQPAVLSQKGCMFSPRVQGVRVGQRLLVDNGDPVTHNVRSFPVVNQAFNFGQPPDTGQRERVFEQAEREIEVQCDIHPWMHAYIFVMDHPFFSVSDDDGNFAIDGLPPGDYTVESWHEKLGKQRKTVTVGDASLGDVNFTYKP